MSDKPFDGTFSAEDVSDNQEENSQEELDSSTNKDEQSEDTEKSDKSESDDSNEKEDSGIPSRYDKDPAWIRIMGKRREAETERDELREEVVKLKAELKTQQGSKKENTEKDEQEKNSSVDEFSEEEEEKYQKWKSRLAGEIADARKAKDEKTEEANKAFQESMKKIREELDTDDKQQEFLTYAKDLVKELPDHPWTVDELYKVYKKNVGIVNSKASGDDTEDKKPTNESSKQSDTNSENTSTTIKPKESFAAAAMRALKQKEKR